MKTNTTTNLGPLSRARFTIPTIAAAGLLLMGLGTVTSRADILYVANPSGRGPGQINKVTSVAVDSVFANVSSGDVTGLAFDNAGNLYGSLSYNNTIEKFASDGTSSVFVSGTSNTLSFPTGLAFDSTGNLYAANYGNSTIEKFTPSGVGSVFANTSGRPQGLAFDSMGNLYATLFPDFGITIEKFTPGGIGSVFTSGGSFAPYGLAFDNAGNLYAASDATIEKFTPGGVGSVFATSSTSILGLTGLAFDSAGNLYAANYYTRTIERFTPSGIGSVFASDPGSETSSGFGLLEFLAFTNDAGVPLKLANQVPEPSTWAMLASGTASLLALRRRKRPL